MMDLSLLARVVAAALWVAVFCKYVLDVLPQSDHASTGQKVTQVGLGGALAFWAFSTALATFVDYVQVTPLTFLNVAFAAVMVVGQHWDRAALLWARHREP